MKRLLTLTAAVAASAGLAACGSGVNTGQLQRLIVGRNADATKAVCTSTGSHTAECNVRFIDGTSQNYSVRVTSAGDYFNAQ